MTIEEIKEKYPVPTGQPYCKILSPEILQTHELQFFCTLPPNHECKEHVAYGIEPLMIWEDDIIIWRAE